MRNDPVTQLRWATCEVAAKNRNTFLQTNEIRPDLIRLSTSNFDVDFGFLNARLVAPTTNPTEMAGLTEYTPSTDEDSRWDTFKFWEAGSSTRTDGDPSVIMGGIEESNTVEPATLQSPPRSCLSGADNDITALPPMPQRKFLQDIIMCVRSFGKVRTFVVFQRRKRRHTA
jgi:hypothetical protein